MATKPTTHPEILWAQRSSETDQEKNIIYLTVNLPNIDESSLIFELTPEGITFKASGGPANYQYEFAFNFFDEIVPELSKHSLTQRHFVAVLRKKEKKAEYWPRLTKEKARTAFIKTDFSKWVDEDEQEGNTNEDEVMGIPGMGDGMGDFGGMDFSKFGSEAAAPAESDSDPESEPHDDGPPPLESEDSKQEA